MSFYTVFILSSIYSKELNIISFISQTEKAMLLFIFRIFVDKGKML